MFIDFFYFLFFFAFMIKLIGIVHCTYHGGFVMVYGWVRLGVLNEVGGTLVGFQ
jgi:hypothetical protein